MKLSHTEVKFYPEVKSQTGLTSLRVSCKGAHRMSTNLPRQAPKWKLTNHGHVTDKLRTKSRNDGIGIIKRNGGDSMKDIKDQH